MDNLDKKVININYPCIQDIVIRKDETDVCFTVSDGQDETKLFLKEGEEIMFTVNIGDVSNIGFGGTDNWGKDRLPLYIEYKKGSTEYDSVFVDSIEIQTLAGDGNWCKCELINNNTTVKYTAILENPYNVTRTAYFYHKTKDDTIKRGYNTGRPASKEWCVTVIQEANPNGKSIEVECNGETVGYGSSNAVTSGTTSSKVVIGKWSKNSDCTNSWVVDNSRQVSGDCFIELNSITFDSDNQIRGVVNVKNTTTSQRLCRIPTIIGNFKDYFTVYQKAGGSEPTPENLGNYKYSVGLISDLHICKANNNDSSNWWDEDDFKRAMGLFVDDTNVKFIASCGDISEAQTNDAVKHPEATCETDYAEFTEMYDVPYWQVAGLRFFSPLGNHDFYGMFESRQGDTITGKKNSETIIGYNAGVKDRLGSWVTGQQINGIVPGRGRIVFDLEEGKTSAVGQADMNFFAYYGYVDIYAKQAGYTGTSIWDANKGGISDEAIKVTKNYVNNNWNTCKDNLSGWQGGSLHGRNGYSKMNYFLKKENDLYIFLSVDYGDDVWGVKSGWHDRMIHARTIINTNTDDPFVKRMVDYVSDTEYSSADKAYNYQYYSPNTLIWLKEIIEGNKDKKIYVFSHHFMPNRVGNGVGVPKNGNWYYSDISPDGVKDSRESGIYNKGSNTLTGIEYWFINKLMNKYNNVIWFSGHSHISFGSGANFDNHEYPIISPSEKNAYVYTKSSETPKRESAWCVAQPSMSKPRDIVDGQSVRRYEDAEMGIMEIYDKGVKIKGYKIKKDNKNVYNLLSEKLIKLI